MQKVSYPVGQVSEISIPLFEFIKKVKDFSLSLWKAIVYARFYMSRYLCIHGHFYQPPRENPWLESIERQDSAHPYHDWNERIAAECYAPNASARILDGEGFIDHIVNNYDRISFNFGPTLLSWMEQFRPDCYAAIQAADANSRKRYNGHGSALAQVYNHIIMPLASSRDKKTQIQWGIRDFQKRFNRRPEGMWLAETAVDIETLELLAQEGITYTLLAPRQASRIRKIGSDEWHDVSGGRVDPRRPYVCYLPSGASIALFFYDGNVSQAVAFENLLRQGETFAGRLNGAFASDWNEPQLVHIATDGETYGHHSSHGDMALAYCLHYIDREKLAEVTIYADYLEKFPPLFEAEIFEGSSWSCIHGVERWRSDCGCCSGMKHGWHQAWRGPLRDALDFLRDEIANVFERQAKDLLKNPWEARNAYIDVILDRSESSLKLFLDNHASHSLGERERQRVRKLLEMQRNGLLMYTSCGWFFDEISGIETVQILQYAARACQLAREVGGEDFEPGFIKLLEKAPSNIPEYGTGAKIYELFVKPARADVLRLAAHYATEALFKPAEKASKLYCYEAHSDRHQGFVLGRNRIATGTVTLTSTITGESAAVGYAAVHLGDHNVTTGVSLFPGEERFETINRDVNHAFHRADIPEIIRTIDRHFGSCTFTLWDLYRDTQLQILKTALSETFHDMEDAFQKSYQEHRVLMNAIHAANLPTPQVFAATVEFLVNTRIRRALESKEPDLNLLQTALADKRQWGPPLDITSLSFLARVRVLAMVKDVIDAPRYGATLVRLRDLLGLLGELGLMSDLWDSQNLYFYFTQQGVPSETASLHREIARLLRIHTV